jgi:hypothetical protein
MALRTVDSAVLPQAASRSLTELLHDVLRRPAVRRGSLGLWITFAGDLAMACAASTLGLIWARDSGCRCRRSG